MAYQPIENYGMIGDMHTVALVSTHGSIDWFCFPNFDSPSVFAAMLDHQKGGHFIITQDGGSSTTKQFYWPETNVLITRFLSPDGVGEITDYMPVKHAKGDYHIHRIIRRVKVASGAMSFRVECRPAFNFARDAHKTTVTAQGACFASDKLSLGLATRIPLKNDGNGVVGKFILREGEKVVFVLQQLENGAESLQLFSEQEASELFRYTVEYWNSWITKCTYKGRWREMVQRSALALKLLTYEPTGAIVAAPTCSLPE
ncbi:MAG: DUF5911 domain-containing protein, partial [Ignavibacteria bacterium]|nr:DUF5911 domain-containing protein [Ignavibacteria bacterium]